MNENRYARKYKLSPQYSLPVITPALRRKLTDVPKDMQPLINSASNHVLLINNEVAEFLKLYLRQGSYKRAIVYYQKKLKVPFKEASLAINAFFNDLLRKGILIEITSHTNAKKSATARYFKKGFKLDQYTIEKLIHEHQPNQIYTAQDAKGKMVVIKILNPIIPLSDAKLIQAKTELHHEFTMLKALRGCKAICKWVKFVPKKSYGVMELIAGRTLKEVVLDTKHPLVIKQRIDLMKQVIEAMAFVHSKQIIHGDLHHSNFMVLQNGTIKLIDFGMSFHVNELGSRKISRGGKYQFIPPERIGLNAFEFASKLPDASSEVFQLGIILYFILYGKMPFSGATWKKLAVSILTQDPIFHKTDFTRELIPIKVIQLVKRCLNKNPNRRFKNAAQLVDSLS